MSTVLNVQTVWQVNHPPPPYSTSTSCLYRVCRAEGHFDVESSAHLWNRAVKQAKTHASWQRALRQTCRFDTHTHTQVYNWLSLTHTHTHTLQLSLSPHLKWHLKWNCWKIKNRSRHFVFHATRRLIIKTDFYMQRQCQRKCMLQAHVHRYLCVCVCVWVSSIQSSWVHFVSVWLGT